MLPRVQAQGVGAVEEEARALVRARARDRGQELAEAIRIAERIAAQAPLAVVAALRETSILFGAVIAFALLKEKLIALRIVAACGIAAGAILLRLS